MLESPNASERLKQTALLLEKLLFPSVLLPKQIQDGLEKYGVLGFFQRLEEMNLPLDTLDQLQTIRLILFSEGQITETIGIQEGSGSDASYL